MTAGPVVICLLLGAAPESEVAALVKVLETPGKSQSEQTEASKRLAQLGPLAVPALADALSHKTPAVRQVAARSLGEVIQRHFYPKTRQAIPALLKAVMDPEPSVRQEVIRTLGMQLLTSRDAAAPDRNILAAFVKSLDDKESDIRTTAADSLAWVSSMATTGVPALMRLTEDKTEMVAETAILALASIGPDAAACLPKLRQRLDRSSGRPRLALAIAVARISQEARPALPILLDAVGTGIPEQLLQSVWQALHEIGFEAVPGLVRLLEEKEEKKQVAALTALHELGPEARAAVPALIRALESPSENVRRMTMAVLGRIGESASPAGAALVRRVRDEKRPMRLEALFALAPLRLTDSEAAPLRPVLKGEDVAIRLATALALLHQSALEADVLPILRTSLRMDNSAIRLFAAKGLAIMGRTQEGVPELCKQLEESTVELEVLRVLQRIGPEAKAAVPLLIERLGKNERQLHPQVADTLGEMGVEAVPALRKALTHRDATVRAGAVLALFRIGPAAAPAVAELTPLLNDPDEDVSFWAIDAHASIGPAAREAVPVLLRKLRDPLPVVRRHAVTALGHVATASKEVVEGLLGALKDEEDTVREEAAAALGWLGPGAKAALPALSETVKRSTGPVRLAAAQALANIDPAHPEGVATLRAALKDANPAQARVAIQDLAALGSTARAAVPDLIELLGGRNRHLRASAAEALGWIGPDRPAVDALVRNLAHESLEVARKTALALRFADPRELRPRGAALSKAMNDPDSELALHAAAALLRSDPGNVKARTRIKEKLTILIRFLEAKRKVPQSPGARLMTQDTLALLELLGHDARAALPLVQRIAKDDPDSAIREKAQAALKAIDRK